MSVPTPFSYSGYVSKEHSTTKRLKPFWKLQMKVYPDIKCHLLTIWVFSRRGCKQLPLANTWTVNFSNSRKWRGNKKPLDEGERRDWKSWLKIKHSKNQGHVIQSHHSMASKGEKLETVTDFIFLGSKITVNSDYSHEIKRCLHLGKKAMTNQDSILKCRDITLLTKVHIVKAMAFPVVMYRCESWTLNKVECQRIDAFILWCWRRHLRVPPFLDSKEFKTVNPRGNQPWIFIERTGAEAEAPVLWRPDM